MQQLTLLHAKHGGLVRAVWTPSFAVTLLASWDIALVVELALVLLDVSLLPHVPFGREASAIPTLSFVLELAYLEAVLAPPACVASAVWLLVRRRGRSPSTGDQRAARLKSALQGLGLGLAIGGWLLAGHVTAPWPAPWSWPGVGLSVAALLLLPLAIAFVLDAALPIVVVEGIIEDVQELRPQRGRPSYLIRIGSVFQSVPRGS